MIRVDPEELLGAMDSLVESVDKYAEPLSARGLAPGTFKTNLQAIRTDLFTKKTARDNQRTALAIAQAAFEDSATQNYRAFSDAIDSVAGTLGKKVPEGLQVLGYRKRLKNHGRHAAPAPPPAPSVR